jgi:hypothetical protein
LDGPATRPKTPLAVENGVGKPAAPLRWERQMSARERECGPKTRNRHEQLSWGHGRIGQGNLLAGRVECQNPERLVLLNSVNHANSRLQKA